MSKKSFKHHQQKPVQTPAAAPKACPVHSLHKYLKPLPYVLTFLLVWVFCTWIYGDVFTRAQQDSYVSGNAVTMKFLTDKDFGTLYWYARYALLVFKSAWVGGLLLALLLTFSTWTLDRVFCLPRSLHGLTSLLGFALLGWMVWRGYSLFYKNEASVIVLYPILLAFAAFILGGIRCALLHLKKKEAAPSSQPAAEHCGHHWCRLPWGSLIVVLAFAGLTTYALGERENEILTCRMQNRVLTGDFEEIEKLADDALSAKSATRSVAAYYAIGLLQTHTLLDRLFDLPFHYPEMPLDAKDGSEEYGIFEADCSFFTGLTNSGYRAAMDKVVMNGPTIYQLKRMALCAIVGGEANLARKYLKLISEMPFEQAFVERYAPMVDDPELVKSDAMLSEVLKLKPEEARFEQNYRRPMFMGYNIGLLSGSNDAIDASIAACLYSKDLKNFLPRAQVLKNIGRPIPLCVQEAIVIHGLKNPDAYQMFPEYAPSNNRPGSPYATVQAFILDIQNYYQNECGAGANWQEVMTKDLKGGVPEKVRQFLEPNWLGHYVYYYYCENLTKKEDKENKNKSGVN